MFQTPPGCTDYSLGGSHNFEADRQAAEYMFTLVPSTKKWVRLLRMFLTEAAEQMSEQGFTMFLDLASGLPTVEHIHAAVPGAKVIYVDSDPVVVSYGMEILGDNPNVRYLLSDIRDIDTILASPVIHELFGDNRKIAIGLNGVTVFLSDEEIQKIMRTTSSWAAPRQQNVGHLGDTRCRKDDTPVGTVSWDVRANGVADASDSPTRTRAGEPVEDWGKAAFVRLQNGSR